MRMNNIPANAFRLTLQYASRQTGVPSRYYFKRWAAAVLADQRKKSSELTIRIVDKEESAALNEAYRHKPGPTNVLSFPFEAPPHLKLKVLGDVVICAPVVAKEALEQQKPLLAHWAHMVVHGVLHLLGYDHVQDNEAEIMEALEIKLLARLGHANPYR